MLYLTISSMGSKQGTTCPLTLSQNKSGLQICRLAGYKDQVAWTRAVKDERFVAELEALGVTRRRRSARVSHLEVTSATNIEEELKKDVWDIRRLKHDYPKHAAPSNYIIDFTWIANPLLNEHMATKDPALSSTTLHP